LPDARRGVHGHDDGGGRRSAARRVLLLRFFVFRLVGLFGLVGLIRRWRVHQLGWRRLLVVRVFRRRQLLVVAP